VIAGPYPEALRLVLFGADTGGGSVAAALAAGFRVPRQQRA
jgi:hypothetical protein